MPTPNSPPHTRPSTSSSSTNGTCSVSGLSRAGTSLDVHSNSSASVTSPSSLSSNTIKPHNPYHKYLHANPTTTNFQAPTASGTSSTESSRRASPTPRRPFFLSNHIHAKDTTATNFTHAPSQPSGLRAQIAHLLPRRALFHVRVSIHQLNSVPFVSGEFGVRWKFKGVSTPRDGGLFGKVKGKGKMKARNDETDDAQWHDQGESSGKGKEKENDTDTDGTGHDTASMFDTSITEVNGTHSKDQQFTIPAVVISGNVPTSSPPLHDQRAVSSASTVSTCSSISSSSRSAHTASRTPPHTHSYAQYLSAEWLPQSQPETKSVPSLSASTSNYVGARGLTPYVRLKDHNVTWESTLNVVVQMGINRETGMLAENEVKLVVVQRVISGDPDAPRNPRLGAVYLNLAEYVGAGTVTRRYLLRQSKTNATLKLTIQLQHIGGETSFTAPPLPKGEILGGVAGLLENDVYRTRPRMHDLYYGCSSDSSLSTISSRDGKPRRRRRKKPFDVARLPHTRGPKGTESMIDALFNPMPTNLRKATPFTYFGGPDAWRKDAASTVQSSKAPAEEEEDTHRDWQDETARENWDDIIRDSSYTGSVDGHVEYDSDHASMHTALSKSASVLSLRSTRSTRSRRSNKGGTGVSSVTASGVDDKPRSWWRKIGILRGPAPASLAVT